MPTAPAVTYLVRSWNLFHGRTHPPGRRAYLESAVRLATADAPDVVCLQEVPVWALERLGRWSGMAVVGDATVRAGVGPVPLPLRLTRRLTDLHHGLLRSLFAGQGNAVLVSPGLPILDHRSLVLNDCRFRRAHGGRLRLGLRGRLRWAIERRICQTVRVSLPDGRSVLVANVHASHIGDERRLADAELARAVQFVESLAGPGDVLVLAGDFNVTAAGSSTLAALSAAGWSPPGPGIDHVLVQGASASPLEVWPDERRRVGDRLLSDHAPVERRFA